jgi:hypothetical protein
MSHSHKPKGTPIHIEAFASYLEIWFSSPTGDASDSHIFTIPVREAVDAENLASVWAEAWGMKWYSMGGRMEHETITVS